MGDAGAVLLKILVELYNFFSAASCHAFICIPVIRVNERLTARSILLPFTVILASK